MTTTTTVDGFVPQEEREPILNHKVGVTQGTPRRRLFVDIALGEGSSRSRPLSVVPKAGQQ